MQSPLLTAGVLTKEQRAAGFSIALDNHHSYLLRGGKQVAVFAAHATVWEVQAEAWRIMKGGVVYGLP